MTTQASADLRSPSAAKRARKSSARAAAATGGGASARGIEQAKTIRNYAPDLAERVMAGTLSLHAAYQATRFRVLAGYVEVDPGCRIRESTRAEPCPSCGGTGRMPAENS